MGQFSWFTNEGERILDNRNLLRPIVMVGQMPDGSIVRFTEDDSYDGYGNFGGKDYYELMAEMNGFTADDFNGDKEKLRRKGIELAFDGDPCGENAPHKYPSLSTRGDWYDGKSPKCDPDQGWGVRREDIEAGLFDLCESDLSKDWDDDEWPDDLDDGFEPSEQNEW